MTFILTVQQIILLSRILNAKYVKEQEVEICFNSGITVRHLSGILEWNDEKKEWIVA